MDTKVDEGSQQDSSEAPSSLREDLVSTAVKFLQNPRVASRPHSEKEKFLRNKGLSSDEIISAFKASGTSTSVPENQLGHYSSLKVAQVHEYSSLVPPPVSRWTIGRDLLNFVVLFAGAAYSLRYLYRKFIAPLLFGKKRKEKKIEEIVQEMNTNLTKMVNDLSAAVKNLSDTVATLNSKQSEKADIKSLKAEVASLKGLMLSRRQFPAPPSTSVGPPSIPAWQLASSSESAKIDLQMEMQPGESNGERNSMSSSPEIISVEDMAPCTAPNANLNSPALSARDPSESSESGSAEIVEMTAGVSGEDTD
nr:EOG090X0FQ8 [Polyphemus pediculus]